MFKTVLMGLQKIGPQLMLQAKPSEVRKLDHFLSVTRLAAAAHSNPFLPMSMQIQLRTVNSSGSCYLAVTLEANFFQAYNVFHCSDLQAVLLFKASGGMHSPQSSAFPSNPVHRTRTSTSKPD